MERRAYTVSIDPQKKRHWTKLDASERKGAEWKEKGLAALEGWQNACDSHTCTTHQTGGFQSCRIRSLSMISRLHLKIRGWTLS